MPRPGQFLRHEDLPYRPCVGIMLVNKDGLVFVGRRIDQTVEGWQMPQGGIDEGETPLEAGLRELKEEVGTDKAKLLAEMDEWLAYDLPPHLLGVALHARGALAPSGAGPQRPRRELGAPSLLEYEKDLAAPIAGLYVPPILLGHSRGGLLAQRRAAQGGARALVLLAPCPPWGIMPST